MNVITHRKDGWYFIDETWSDEYGPYRSRRKASRKLRKYGRILNKKKEKKG